MIKLHPEEKVLAVERRHWLPITLESLSLVLAALAPILLLVGAEFLPQEAGIAVEEYRALAWFLYTVWLIGIWLTFAIMISDYYLDVLVVTTKRLIDIEQKGLFARDLAEIHLNHIEDIRVEVSGLIPSYFNYGDLHVQSAAESREFSLKNIHDPHRVKDIIFRQHDIVAREMNRA